MDANTSLSCNIKDIKKAMGRRSQSDISNTAIRIFLQSVGELHDKKRGHDHLRRPWPSANRSYLSSTLVAVIAVHP
jgi:hypothetical protein